MNFNAALWERRSLRYESGIRRSLHVYDARAGVAAYGIWELYAGKLTSFMINVKFLRDVYLTAPFG
jgi:hypothetical protein